MNLKQSFNSLIKSVSYFAIGLLICCASLLPILIFGNTNINDKYSLCLLLDHRVTDELVVAIGEETLIRFFLYKLAIKVFSKQIVSVALCSLVFSCLHLSNPNYSWIAFVGHFIAGVYYSYSYIISNNLTLPIGIHFTWNFVQGPVLSLPVSGVITEGYFETVITGPVWWNGGTYGIEGGLIGLIARLLIVLLLYVFAKKNLTKSCYVDTFSA